MGPILTHLIYLKPAWKFYETEVVTCQGMTTMLFLDIFIFCFMLVLLFILSLIHSLTEAV